MKTVEDLENAVSLSCLCLYEESVYTYIFDALENSHSFYVHRPFTKLNML